jgi:hypothetical protein
MENLAALAVAPEDFAQALVVSFSTPLSSTAIAALQALKLLD